MWVLLMVDWDTKKVDLVRFSNDFGYIKKFAEESEGIGLKKEQKSYKLEYGEEVTFELIEV